MKPTIRGMLLAASLLYFPSCFSTENAPARLALKVALATSLAGAGYYGKKIYDLYRKQSLLRSSVVAPHAPFLMKGRGLKLLVRAAGCGLVAALSTHALGAVASARTASKPSPNVPSHGALTLEPNQGLVGIEPVEAAIPVVEVQDQDVLTENEASPLTVYVGESLGVYSEPPLEGRTPELSVAASVSTQTDCLPCAGLDITSGIALESIEEIQHQLDLTREVSLLSVEGTPSSDEDGSFVLPESSVEISPRLSEEGDVSNHAEQLALSSFQQTHIDGSAQSGRNSGVKRRRQDSYRGLFADKETISVPAVEHFSVQTVHVLNFVAIATCAQEYDTALAQDRFVPAKDVMSLVALYESACANLANSAGNVSKNIKLQSLMSSTAEAIGRLRSNAGDRLVLMNITQLVERLRGCHTCESLTEIAFELKPYYERYFDPAGKRLRKGDALHERLCDSLEGAFEGLLEAVEKWKSEHPEVLVLAPISKSPQDSPAIKNSVNEDASTLLSLAILFASPKPKDGAGLKKAMDEWYLYYNKYFNQDGSKRDVGYPVEQEVYESITDAWDHLTGA